MSFLFFYFYFIFCCFVFFLVLFFLFFFIFLIFLIFLCVCFMFSLHFFLVCFLLLPYFAFFVFGSLVLIDCSHFWVPLFVCSPVFSFFSFLSASLFLLVWFCCFLCLQFGVSICFVPSFIVCVCCVVVVAVCFCFCYLSWLLSTFFCFFSPFLSFLFSRGLWAINSLARSQASASGVGVLCPGWWTTGMIYSKWWKGKTESQEYSTQQGSHSDLKEKSKGLQTSKS